MPHFASIFFFLSTREKSYNHFLVDNFLKLQKKIKVTSVFFIIIFFFQNTIIDGDGMHA